MIGYILKADDYRMPEFFASWQELVETLAEVDSPKTRITIDTCVYHEGDFKDKSDE